MPLVGIYLVDLFFGGFQTTGEKGCNTMKVGKNEYVYSFDLLIIFCINC